MPLTPNNVVRVVAALCHTSIHYATQLFTMPHITMPHNKNHWNDIASAVLHRIKSFVLKARCRGARPTALGSSIAMKNHSRIYSLSSLDPN